MPTLLDALAQDVEVAENERDKYKAQAKRWRNMAISALAVIGIFAALALISS